MTQLCLVTFQRVNHSDDIIKITKALSTYSTRLIAILSLNLEKRSKTEIKVSGSALTVCNV